MKTILVLILAVLTAYATGFAMSGGPLFCLGPGISSMTVEATQAEMKVPMASISEDRESMSSRRLFLTGRYGFQPNVDIEGRLGVADLTYSAGRGYSEYSTSPSFAWGAALRMGFPQGEKYQFMGSLSYTGFRANGTSNRGAKSVESTYLWQEVAPTLTMGYQFRQIVPYVGVTKPYLFGSREFNTSYGGDIVRSASGTESYSDGEQSIRGLAGLEWKLPDGYSVNGECAAASDGSLTLSIGIAQALK